jgi:hypothetical protein
MKQLLIRALISLSFGTLFLLSVQSIHAQSVAGDSFAKIQPAQIRFLGTQDDMVLFHVAYQNWKGNKFSILIKDQEGALLYQRVFSDSNFIHQYSLPKTDKSKFTFIIRHNGEPDITRTFEVSINSRMEEAVAVRKLD